MKMLITILRILKEHNIMIREIAQNFWQELLIADGDVTVVLVTGNHEHDKVYLVTGNHQNLPLFRFILWL